MPLAAMLFAEVPALLKMPLAGLKSASTSCSTRKFAMLPTNEAADPEAKLNGRFRPNTSGSNSSMSFAISKSGMNSSLPTICRPGVVKAVDPAKGSVLKLIVFASAPDTGPSMIAAVATRHFMLDRTLLNICCSCECLFKQELVPCTGQKVHWLLAINSGRSKKPPPNLSTEALETRIAGSIRRPQSG